MMDPNVRLLSVAFDTPIEPWELPAFRAAIAQKAGLEHDIYHNHDNENGGYHYRLPLIQYKQDHGRPMLLCLNEGIEELQHFFSRPDWTLHLNGRPLPIRIADIKVRHLHLGVTERQYRYHIRHWIGLRDDNYGVYTRLDGALERLYLLERTLFNQVDALLRQLDNPPRPEQPLQVKILKIQQERWVTFKKVKVLAFSLEFSSNAFLPDYVGLGKGVSLGWGVVKGLGVK